MRKNFYLAALAVLALASCSKSEIIDEKPTADKTPMVFTSYAGAETRAAADASNVVVGDLQTDGFKVVGVEKESTSATTGNVYLNNLTYSWNGTASKYDNAAGVKYYWPNKNTYMDFHAVYPAGKTITLGTNNIGASINYAAYAEADFAEDVVAANKLNESCLAHTTPATVSSVALAFSHIKNQVSFAFCSNSDDTNLTTTVKSVKLTYVKSGTYTYATSSADAAWGSQVNETTTPKEYYATATAVEKLATSGTQSYTALGTGLLMIPAAAALTVTVEYDVKQTNNGNYVVSDFTGKNAKTFTITPSAMNTKYLYNVKLPVGVEPITFTATLSDWTDSSNEIAVQ